jgi:hypothetical protein
VRPLHRTLNRIPSAAATLTLLPAERDSSKSLPPRRRSDTLQERRASRLSLAGVGEDETRASRARRERRGAHEFCDSAYEEAATRKAGDSCMRTEDEKSRDLSSKKRHVETRERST